MGVARRRQTEGPSDGDLARRRREQVVAAGDEVDAGGGVVDDHGEVVGRNAVVAAQHDVGRHALEPAGDESSKATVPPPARKRTAAVRSARRSVRWRSVRSRQRPGYVSAESPCGAAAASRISRREQKHSYVSPAGAARRAPPRRRRSVHSGARPHRPSRSRGPRGRPVGRARARGADVTRSRSSMRSRKASPADRASSQAIRAVRRLPTCNEPVGDGAKRPGIGDSVPSACGRPARVP